MVTYNTRFANNSNLQIQNEDDLESAHSTTSFHHHSPETSHNSKRKTGLEQIASTGFKKSKTFQNNHHLNLQAQKSHHNHQTQYDSPIYKKLDVRQNRKCRRSNTTFTMAGMRKNKIIDYFNKLELNKPISTASSRPKLFSSNREMAVCGLNANKKDLLSKH